MIVTDASILIEFLLRTPTGEAAEKDLLAPGESLHAPGVRAEVRVCTSPDV